MPAYDLNRWIADLANVINEAALLAEPLWADPLRRHDCPPISDGAAVVILAAGSGSRVGQEPLMATSLAAFSPTRRAASSCWPTKIGAWRAWTWPPARSATWPTGR